MQFLLLLAAYATAADLDIPYERYELDNGLDVILIEDHSAPMVHTNVWYHVGSKDETAGLTGFAHLFEHLMFNGSKNSDQDYFQTLAEVGARVNGTTNKDRTNYFETLPAEWLPRALFLESDRMGWLLPALTQEKMDVQQGVVRNERRQRYENPPYGEAWVHISNALYPDGHPYQHQTIGSHEDLENATLDDVKAFFEKWYVPNNASLVIAGDIDPAKTKELVQSQFGGIPRGADITPTTVEPTVLEEDKVLRLKEDVPHQKVWMVWHSPAFFAAGDAELDLFSSAFGDGKDSRLYQRLVQDKQIARNIRAYQSSQYLGSQYVVAATANKGHTTDEIVAEVDAVLQEMLGDKPLTDNDVKAGVANFERMFYGAITTIHGKADLVNRYNMYVGDPGFISKDLARYQAADVAGITEQARATLTGNRVILHIWPEDKAPAEPFTEAPLDKKALKQKRKEEKAAAKAAKKAEKEKGE